MKSTVGGKICLLLVLISLFVFNGCDKKDFSRSTATTVDILGVGIGMDRDEAQRHLREVGRFERAEPKRQEVWALPDNPTYSRAVLGYDGDGKVRYITAFARSTGNEALIRYENFGDLKTARQNVFMANKEYVWETAAKDGKPGFFVIIRGYDPVFATSASLMRSATNGQKVDDDDDDKD